jgi:UDP-2,4-diacetamido-2,4,6-trideoxy-beta-L-altropyranose hydrolase
MRIAFRVDASERVGTGHLRRCMSLAEALRARGAELCFVLRRHDRVAERVVGDIGDTILWLDAPSGSVPLAADDPPHAGWAGLSWDRDVAETIDALAGHAPDWLVIDHYAFDARWHEAARAALGCAVLSVDDLGDRSHSVEILLDANAAIDHEEKYKGRLNGRPRMLTGPRYALLASAYRTAPRYAFSDTVDSIGIFMGGTDPGAVSARVLRALRVDASFDGAVELVSTSANPHLADLRRACDADGRATLSLDLSDLSAFYARHDLQIGAGGTSTYERCCIGAPSVSLVLAENQLTVVPVLDAMGALRGASLEDVNGAALLAAPPLGDVVRDLIENPAARRELARIARTLVDARGAERVALAMLAREMTVRPAAISDGATLHAWRNHPATRAVSATSAEISLADHLSWLERVLADTRHTLMVAEIGKQPVGSIRFDRLDDASHEVSLYLDPALHGLGLGAHMLHAGEQAVAVAGRTMFVASVLAGNAASAALFARCGYSGGPLRYSKSIN